jgi:DNA recombination-dependent growth factor C
MGLLSASASISRFRVKGEPKPDYREHYPLQIRRYGFRELDENSAEERSVGWVNMWDVLDSQFVGEGFFRDNFIALSLRIDVRKVPANALKYYRLKAETEQRTRLNKKFLSKAEREEIRERVNFQLLQRAIPRTAVYDMIWNLETQTVLFSSLNNTLCAEFAELFKKTFDLGLIALFPYTIANKYLTEEQFTCLDQIQPCSFC